MQVIKVVVLLKDNKKIFHCKKSKDTGDINFQKLVV